MENLQITLGVFTKSFTKALTLLGGAIKSNPIVPACGTIHLKVNLKENVIVMKSTDTHMSILIEITPGTIELHGDEDEFTIPYDLAIRLLRTLPDGPLDINYYHDVETDDKGRQLEDVYTVQLVSDRQEFKMATFNSKEFPKMTTGNGEEFSVPASVLREGIGSIKNLVSTDEAMIDSARGIFIQLKGKKIRIMASDRFSYGFYVADVETEMEKYISIPFPAAKFIQENLDLTEQNVTLTITDSHLIASCDNWMFASNLNTDLRDIGYEGIKVIEKTMIARVDVAEWRSQLRRALIFANKEGVIDHRFDGKDLYINAENAEKSTESEQFMLVEEASEEFEVSFSGAKLLKVLNNLSGMIKVLKVKGYTTMLFEDEELEGIELTYATAPISKLQTA